jgi:uncharacterized protein YbjT (DUF2867 family)
MKLMGSGAILVTGSTGYVGGRLVPALLEAGYAVRVLVRSPGKLSGVSWGSQVEVISGDADDPAAVAAALDGIRVAFYLLHSLGSGPDFHQAEEQMAQRFADAAAAAGVVQIVYLGGIVNDANLSAHLSSRRRVGEVLRSTGVPVLELRAGIILGSGSASFEMLRYLTEHLPAMITPRWARNRTQPIATRDVIHYLAAAAGLPDPVDGSFDVAGPDTLTYIEMMQRFAAVEGLRRRVIVPVPVLTPRLSSLWVGVVTPVPASIARPLVGSLINEVVAVPECSVSRILPDPPGGLLGFDAAVARALQTVGFGQTPTRWSDASGSTPPLTLTAADPPWAGGTEFVDLRTVEVDVPADQLWPVIERIGGRTGWYGFDWAWKLRGALDRMVGGVGLRRGRRDPQRLRVGDALDFWRVLDVQAGSRLLLKAEMRLPGRAFLEFTLWGDDGRVRISQRATFRPHGLLGWAYWYALLPVHSVLFPVMLNRIVRAGISECSAGAPPSSQV